MKRIIDMLGPIPAWFEPFNLLQDNHVVYQILNILAIIIFVPPFLVVVTLGCLTFPNCLAETRGCKKYFPKDKSK